MDQHTYTNFGPPSLAERLAICEKMYTELWDKLGDTQVELDELKYEFQEFKRRYRTL